MKKLICAVVSIGFFLFLGSCAMLQEPPSTIYPNPQDDPQNYPP